MINEKKNREQISQKWQSQLLERKNWKMICGGIFKNQN